jgi:hypothetical protein
MKQGRERGRKGWDREVEEGEKMFSWGRDWAKRLERTIALKNLVNRMKNHLSDTVGA